MVIVQRKARSEPGPHPPGMSESLEMSTLSPAFACCSFHTASPAVSLLMRSHVTLACPISSIVSSISAFHSLAISVVNQLLP